MGRIIAGVILGYVVMFVVIFATFSLAYAILGVDGSFKPESFEVTGTWVVISLILSIAAALAGGYVCVVIARDQQAAMYLAGAVLILGIVMAIPVLTADDSEKLKVRTSDLSNNEAMMQAQQPTWMTLLNPLIGAVGAFYGGRLVKRRETDIAEPVEHDDQEENSTGGA